MQKQKHKQKQINFSALLVFLIEKISSDIFNVKKQCIFYMLIFFQKNMFLDNLHF